MLLRLPPAPRTRLPLPHVSTLKMDPVGQQPEADQPELSPLGKMAFHFLQFGANTTNNLSKTFGDITLQGWIRLVMIIGGYMLIRPWLMKAAGKVGVNQLEKQDAEDKAKAKISPNELRGQKPEPEEEDAGATGADWGEKARVRQREVLKQLIEAEEKRREEEEDLKDIEEFLED